MGVFKLFSSGGDDRIRLVQSWNDDQPKPKKKKLVKKKVKESEKQYVLPNPNPSNYKVLNSVVINEYLIVSVNYPDSTNYEGNKILMFDRGVTIDKLIAQGEIDPHFSESKNHIYPIARFIPSEWGWQLAINAAKSN